MDPYIILWYKYLYKRNINVKYLRGLSKEICQFFKKSKKCPRLVWILTGRGLIFKTRGKIGQRERGKTKKTERLTNRFWGKDFIADFKKTLRGGLFLIRNPARFFWIREKNMLELDIRPFDPLVSLLFGKQYSLYERCMWGFVTAFVVALIIGKPIIRTLSRHQVRQVFRTKQQVKNLAILHDHKKGVPTMGGIIIALASLVAVAIWASFNDLVITALLVYFFCSLLGAADDILKIIKGNSKGVASGQKLCVQALITGFIFYIASQNPPINNLLMYVPWKWFHGYFEPSIAMVLIIVFYFCVIAGTSNAVNLTDGIDGLAIVNIALCFVPLAVCAFYSSNVNIARETMLSYIAGSTELAVLCTCFAGGCLAFGIFNIHPASIFMGDMGSIGLGGLLAIVACLLRLPFILLAVGIIFVIETLSVMLQVTSKKVFKRRVFLMAPLHHHFELKGFLESEIVKAAFCLQVICVLITLFVVFYGYAGHH